MKRNQPSSNTRRAADEEADRKSQADINLEIVKDRDKFRESSPEWTAVLTQSDPKTLRMKWVKTDEINDKIF